MPLDPEAVEALARLDKIIEEYAANPTMQRQAKLARALREAERRVAEGIGRRVIHVVVGQAIMTTPSPTRWRCYRVAISRITPFIPI